MGQALRVAIQREELYSEHNSRPWIWYWWRWGHIWNGDGWLGNWRMTSSWWRCPWSQNPLSFEALNDPMEKLGPKSHWRKKCRRRRSSPSAFFLRRRDERTAHVSKRALATPKSELYTTPSRSNNNDAVTTVTHHLRQEWSRASTPVPLLWTNSEREKALAAAHARIDLHLSGQLWWALKWLENSARFGLGELQEEMLRFLWPSPANFARQHDQTCPPESSCQFRVRAFLPPSSCAQHCPILFRSTPVRVQSNRSGDTMVASSASWAPWNSGRRSSCISRDWRAHIQIPHKAVARNAPSLFSADPGDSTLDCKPSSAEDSRIRTCCAVVATWIELTPSAADARNGRQGLPKTQEENAELLRVKRGVEWRWRCRKWRTRHVPSLRPQESLLADFESCSEARDTSSKSSSCGGRAPFATSTHDGDVNPILINWSLLELALLTWTPPPRSSKAWSNSSAMNGCRALTIGRQSAQLDQHAADLERMALARPYPPARKGRCATSLGAPSARTQEVRLSTYSSIWSTQRKAGATMRSANLALQGSSQRGKNGTGKPRQHKLRLPQWGSECAAALSVDWRVCTSSPNDEIGGQPPAHSD